MQVMSFGTKGRPEMVMNEGARVCGWNSGQGEMHDEKMVWPREFLPPRRTAGAIA